MMYDVKGTSMVSYNMLRRVVKLVGSLWFMWFTFGAEQTRRYYCGSLGINHRKLTITFKISLGFWF